MRPVAAKEVARVERVRSWWSRLLVRVIAYTARSFHLAALRHDIAVDHCPIDRILDCRLIPTCDTYVRQPHNAVIDTALRVQRKQREGKPVGWAEYLSPDCMQKTQRCSDHGHTWGYLTSRQGEGWAAAARQEEAGARHCNCSKRGESGQSAVAILTHWEGHARTCQNMHPQTRPRRRTPACARAVAEAGSAGRPARMGAQILLRPAPASSAPT